MVHLSPAEAYRLLRSISDHEREFRARAGNLLAARDQLISVLDGQDGIRRAGMAASAGISAARITYMLNRESPEGLAEAVAVPPELRDAIAELAPDLGPAPRKLITRA